MRRSFSTLSSFKMSTYTTDKASPFTRAVVRAMRRLYVLSQWPFDSFFVFGWGKADDVVCLRLGIRRSWLIVVSIILGVSFMVILRGFM